MLANTIDKETRKPLGGGLPTKIIMNKGRKIGLIGLIEKEWLVSVNPCVAYSFSLVFSHHASHHTSR
jgi:hypothetical protein